MQFFKKRGDICRKEIIFHSHSGEDWVNKELDILYDKIVTSIGVLFLTPVFIFFQGGGGRIERKMFEMDKTKMSMTKKLPEGPSQKLN